MLAAAFCPSTTWKLFHSLWSTAVSTVPGNPVDFNSSPNIDYR